MTYTPATLSPMTKTTNALRWYRSAPGFHNAILRTTLPGGGVRVHEYCIQRVTLDDGPWWIVVYPDHSHSDPTQYLATAKAWAEQDAAEIEGAK